MELLVDEPPEPPEPPPELVQLDTPPQAMNAISATNRNVLRRRQKANGRNSNPQAGGSARQPAGGDNRADVPDFPV